MECTFFALIQNASQISTEKFDCVIEFPGYSASQNYWLFEAILGILSTKIYKVRVLSHFLTPFYHANHCVCRERWIKNTCFTFSNHIESLIKNIILLFFKKKNTYFLWSSRLLGKNQCFQKIPSNFDEAIS